ncbi:conserved hypothetical protein [uncultured Desulfatiglans sp.]|uniref:Alginate export domain-containing protein n=1 Tax=Uncultured Desulfatiglans sp. TaxID=1748965 RepID=A0A653ABU7_UNCDX|nr:conserved hypothetical protein [uncultured Desulfatiglans sp.]
MFSRTAGVLIIFLVLWSFGLLTVHREAKADWLDDRLKGIELGPGKLDLSANVRFRYEYMDQFNIQTYGTGRDDEVLLTRVRINLGYRLPQKAMFFVQLQDARFFLSDLDKDDFGRSCPYLNELDLRQAFMEWREIGKSPLGFKVGRQAIKYGDNRIFGPGDWGNVGRYTWDAGKLLWQSKSVDVDVFAGERIFYLKDEFDDEHYPYKAYAAYAQIKAVPDNKLDLFYVVKYDSDETTKGESGLGDLLVQTVGFYAKGKWNRLDYASTFAYQFGDYGQDSVRAFGFNVEGGYTFPAPWKPRLAAALSYASGDDDPKDGRHGTFDGVFGAIDLYYGRMNLFSWMNLVDLQVGVGVKPAEKMKLSLDYHHFRLAEDRDAWYYCTGKKMRWDPTGSSGSELGDEIDLIWKYQVCPRIGLMAGCAGFYPGEFVEKTGSHEDAYWAFGQIEIKI